LEHTSCQAQNKYHHRFIHSTALSIKVTELPMYITLAMIFTAKKGDLTGLLHPARSPAKG
jgi:hypothetical protein